MMHRYRPSGASRRNRCGMVCVVVGRFPLIIRPCRSSFCLILPVGTVFRRRYAPHRQSQSACTMPLQRTHIPQRFPHVVTETTAGHASPVHSAVVLGVGLVVDDMMISICWLSGKAEGFLMAIKYLELTASNMLAVTNLAISVNLALIVLVSCRECLVWRF